MTNFMLFILHFVTEGVAEVRKLFRKGLDCIVLKTFIPSPLGVYIDAGEARYKNHVRTG